MGSAAFRAATLIWVLATATVAASDDPFVGKWRMKQELAPGQFKMTIQEIGPNTYRFALTYMLPTTVIADGKQHPNPNGGTTSLQKHSDGSWKIIDLRPSGEKAETTDIVSSDGRVLNAETRITDPAGQVSVIKYQFRRVGSGTGLVGEWGFAKLISDNRTPTEILIQRYEGNGLTFSTPKRNEKQSIKFDGKDYPDTGPDVPKGSVSSAKRVNSHTIQMTDKIGDKLMDTQEIVVSADGRTLTIKYKPADGAKESTATFTKVQ